MTPETFVILAIAAFFVSGLNIQAKKTTGFRGFLRREIKIKSDQDKEAKKSWYWGNQKWTDIRERRILENSKRYRLSKGICRCERCGIKCEGKDIHCDHVYPRSIYRKYQYSYWNTQILCSTCNVKKSDKTDGYNWRLLRQMRLHPVVWYLRHRQKMTRAR